MDLSELQGRTLTFIAPSGFEYTIREQNGEDDDILSNASEAMNLMNVSRFIAGLVVNTNYTENGKLSPEQVHNMPSLDRYCIMFKSRIFSIGKELDFSYNWDNGPISYTQDLEEFLFPNYGEMPSEELLQSKPDAIPYYPQREKFTDIPIQTTSGKQLMFDLNTPKSEAYMINLPEDKRTKNQELIARNLRMLVDDRWEKVTNFRLFSVKDMQEIRKQINALDPIFTGTTSIQHPLDGRTEIISIIAMPNFFYPEEI